MSLKIEGTISHDVKPTWPPMLNSLVALQHPNYRDIFIGKVWKINDSSTIATLLLINNAKFIDDVLVSHGMIPDTHKKNGLIALLPTYAWQYINKEKLHSIMKTQGLQPDPILDIEVNSKFNDAMSAKPITEALYDDPIRDKALESLMLDEKDSLIMEDGRMLKFDSIFKDRYTKVVQGTEFTPITSEFVPTGEEIKNTLLTKLKSSTQLEEKHKIIVVSKKNTILNIVDDKIDEQNEGQQIVSWITTHMVLPVVNGIAIFADLKMMIFGGYVHITRNGITPTDIITTQHVGKLEYFNFQYGRPIDYPTLKGVLFTNSFQSEVAIDSELKKEAEKIFMQEYLIALQPEPEYQIWALKRVITAWYADTNLTHNIRKIKVLINQYRARGDSEFNRTNGILPSIVVYPRYGKASATIVLQKLSEYFALYQNIGWNLSTPSYFTKFNNLMWYSNGSNDLKLYYRRTQQSSLGTLDGKSFNETFTKINGAPDLTYPHINSTYKVDL
jgi:hypothetical protein